MIQRSVPNISVIKPEFRENNKFIYARFLQKMLIIERTDFSSSILGTINKITYNGNDSPNTSSRSQSEGNKSESIQYFS